MKRFEDDFFRRLEALRLAVRRAAHGRREGDRPTNRRGGASEFIAHRTYTQGDEFRSIDWHVYARLGQLFVRVRSREEPLTLHVVVDTSPSMGIGAPSKLDFAVRVAGALAAVAVVESGDVVFWDSDGPHACDSLGAALRILESTSTGGQRPAESFRRLRREGRSRGAVAFLSDLWDEGLREPLLEGASAGDVAVIHVLTPAERKPEPWGKVRLADIESREELDRFVGEEEIARYGELLAEHCEEWERWCLDHELNYVRCGSEASWEEVVTVALRDAGVLE